MPERKRKTGLIIGLIVGAIVIAAVAVILALTLGNTTKTSKLLGRWNIAGMHFVEQKFTLEEIKELGFADSYIEFKEDNKLLLSLYGKPAYEIRYDEEKGVTIDNYDIEREYVLEDNDNTITINDEGTYLTFKKQQ
ncbi:MAG: hypothetical protein MJ154_00475 [Candidatus Saccharibacteria bacterium]|nr:hypothetical protein [Candidatus Saccharibacteria bacterium]